MVDTIIRTVLGPFGVKLLDLYLEYSLWVNGVILLYAAAVVLGRRTYKITLEKIESVILANRPKMSRYRVDLIERIYTENSIPWDQVMKSTPFPLIVRPGSWLVFPKTSHTLKRLIDPKTVALSLADQMIIRNKNE